MVRAFTLITCTFCSHALACTFPFSGPEYDKLISVKKNEEADSFHLELPKKLAKTEAAKVYLSYSKIDAGELHVAEFSEELKFWFSWKVISGNFEVPKKDGYVPYIHVVWPGELCDTVANSRNLDGAE